MATGDAAVVSPVYHVFAGITDSLEFVAELSKRPAAGKRYIGVLTQSQALVDVASAGRPSAGVTQSPPEISAQSSELLGA